MDLQIDLPYNYKATCLQCANKGMDGNDKMYCMAVRTNAENGFGFLWHKREGFKETPEWCPLQEISLKMIK